MLLERLKNWINISIALKAHNFQISIYSLYRKILTTNSAQEFPRIIGEKIYNIVLNS